MPRTVATLGASKYNDGAGLLLHKRKDSGAQWLYRYTIHGRRREMGLGALRDVSLKKVVTLLKYEIAETILGHTVGRQVERCPIVEQTI